MPVVDAAFFPVVVAKRPADPLYRQLPTGTDPAAARLAPATEVRPGDWVLGSYDGALDETRLRWLMQSAACFPALPVAVNGMIALDGESPMWDRWGLVLIVPRGRIPAGTYGDRAGGYLVGDRVERSILYTPTHDDPRASAGVTRPVLQRGTVTDVEDDAVSIRWHGNWINGHVTETGFRLVDPVRVERERSVFGFAVGDSVNKEGTHGTGTVLELYYHPWAGMPMARVYWPGSPWDDSGHYDFAETSRFAHALPASTV